METQGASIDFGLLQRIQNRVNIPLVIHGSSGVPDHDLEKLVKTRVGKINIGTALRMAFGHTMRAEMDKNPNAFDRVSLFQEPMAAVEATSKQKLDIMGCRGRA
jgi:fructose-bisphosphate aldolase class II